MRANKRLTNLTPFKRRAENHPTTSTNSNNRLASESQHTLVATTAISS